MKRKILPSFPEQKNDGKKERKRRRGR